MRQSTNIPSNVRLHAIAIAAATLMAACGGSDNAADTAAAPPVAAPPPSPTSVTITGTAADGPLQGANACYDLNDNGACDAGEPPGTTNADGAFTLTVAIADAGKHRVVVDVPATAIDKDTGAAVGTAYKLQSPASGTAGAQAVFVSPLTTLVQAHADATGATLADAVELVKSQAGLNLSPLADFVASKTDDAKAAAMTARVVQRAVLQQADALKSTVGQPDISGTTMTQADVDRLVVKTIIGMLPTVGLLAADPALAAASGAELQAKLTAAAQAAVVQGGLTAQAVPAAVGVVKLPPDAPPSTAAAPVATASLTALRYTDANNWYYRTIESSAADNTPDANGNTRYYSVYAQSESSSFSPAGVVNRWGINTTLARSGDVHWNGSAWVGCPLFTRNTSAKRDANGRSSYDYCDGAEPGISVRSSVDIGGKAIAAVIGDTIRKFPGGASGVAFANFGPADLSLLGSATFPAGSKLYYQTNTVAKTAVTYDVSAGGVVQVYGAAVAAGGDARTTASLACAGATVVAAPAATLEALIDANPGKPCVFGKATGSNGDASLEANEWWSNSTASLGVVSGGIAKPANTGDWYSSDQRLRVAFAPASGGTRATTYYSCFSRTGTGSARNCSAIGSGSYSIETLGDARVMRLSGLPSATAKLGYTRVFVERAGKVWFGFQNPAGASTNSIRLNLDATNAIFDKLGIAPVRPVARAADLSGADKAALTTMAGVWGSADADGADVLRFDANGRFLKGTASGNAALREQTGAEVGFYSLDAASGKLSTLAEVDSDLTAGTSHPAASQAVSVSDDAITGSGADVFTLNRLAPGTSPIHGMWALGSATELKTQHFVFFANGRVLMIDPLGETDGGACATAKQGPSGGEYASYSWDAAAGRLRVFGKVWDTNGCAGFFDSSAGSSTANADFVATFIVAGDGKTAAMTTAGGTSSTLYRIPAK